MPPSIPGSSLCRFLAGYLSEFIILVVGVTAFVTIWPLGEYTVLDDWAFALSLHHLYEDGKLVVMDWVPMTLIGHLVWGWLFTAIFGFSLTVTKIAVGIAGIICVLSVHSCLRSLSVDRPIALLAGLCLLLNPLYLFHATLFMTDVTSLMFIWLTLLCWTNSMFSEIRVNLAGLAIGSFFAGMSYLTRQHGIALPIAFMVYAAWRDRRLLFLKPLLAALLPCAALIVMGSIWSSSSSQPTSQFRIASKLVREFCLFPQWMELPYILWSYAVYIGLFAGPVVLSLIRIRLSGRSRTRSLSCLTALGFGIGYWLYATINGWRFPYVPNVISEFGMFHPNEFVVGDRPILWGKGTSGFIGELGIIAACGLLWIVWGVRRNCDVAESAVRRDSDVSRDRFYYFLLVLFVLQLGYVFATSPIVFDRHLLVFAPTVIALAAIRGDSLVTRRLPIVILWLVVYGFYGIAGSHDIHAISREAFLTGDDLHNAGVSLEHIDAGYAFDGWHMYEQSQFESPTELIAAPPWWPNKRLPPSPAEFMQPWWVGHLYQKIDPQYVVAISAPLPYGMYGDQHYKEIDCSRSYRTYWPFQKNRTYSFKRRSKRNMSAE